VKNIDVKMTANDYTSVCRCNNRFSDMPRNFILPNVVILFLPTKGSNDIVFQLSLVSVCCYLEWESVDHFFTLHTPETNPSKEEVNCFNLSFIMTFFIAESDTLKNAEHSLEVTDVGCSLCIKNCD
jgi:hypothetical protein